MTTQPNNLIDTSQLLKKFVLTADGREIGQVHGAMFDTGSWKISRLLIKLHRSVLDDLDLKKPLFRTQTISVPTRVVSGVSDTIVLVDDLDTLEFTSSRAEPRSAKSETKKAPKQKAPSNVTQHTVTM